MTLYPPRSTRILPVKDDLSRIKKAVKRFALLTAIVILFIIVASDGEWFPWANFGALAGLAGIVEVMSK